MLETGPINRFADVGNFVSYRRKVSTVWVINEKQKGKGNRKCEIKYLAWAFSEAAELVRRFDKDARAYYNGCLPSFFSKSFTLQRAGLFLP